MLENINQKPNNESLEDAYNKSLLESLKLASEFNIQKEKLRSVDETDVEIKEELKLKVKSLNETITNR